MSEKKKMADVMAEATRVLAASVEANEKSKVKAKTTKVTKVSAKQLVALRDKAGMAGDKKQFALFAKALKGDKASLVACAKVIAASTPAATKGTKVLARSGLATPKLDKLAKLIDRRIISEADIIGAIGEVCRENNLAPALARALTTAISTAFDSILAVDGEGADSNVIDL